MIKRDRIRLFILKKKKVQQLSLMKYIRKYKVLFYIIKNKYTPFPLYNIYLCRNTIFFFLLQSLTFRDLICNMCNVRSFLFYFIEIMTFGNTTSANFKANL